MDKKLFGRRLNTARKSRGLTSERLSELCYIDATYLRQIEAGIKTPSLPLFIELCRALHASPSYLLSDVLRDCDTGKADELWDLWEKATPKQLEMITAIIKAVLPFLEEQ